MTAKEKDELAKKLNLTKKQRAFCEEYIVDLNGSQAAIRAGYSKSGARQEGNRLLSNANVQAFLAALVEERSKRLDHQADDVLRELINLSQVDVMDYWARDERNGHFVFSLEHIATLPKNVRKRIKGIKPTKDGFYIIELYSLHETLKLIQNHLGLIQRIDLTTNGESLKNIVTLPNNGRET